MAWVSERHRMQMVGCLCLLLLGWSAGRCDGVQMEDGDVRRGAFEAVFSERCPESNVENIFKRMGQKTQPRPSLGNDYRIGDESYAVYVPSDYTKDTAYGLLAWVGAGDRGDVPQDFAALMDEHKLIWVGAHGSGNRHNVPGRRMALALDGVHNMRRMYNIDPNRIYVSGISGGGRVASILAMHYPDVFAGGIFVVGVEYWEAIAATGRPGHVWKPIPKPQAKYLAMARERGRYVLLTGDHDSNRRQTKDYYEYGYKKKLRHVLYIQVPGMGHAMPPAQWYEKAIVFLDTAMAKAGK
ncbi:MAG: prolyl oligopeptidase family serine peptidase [Planctomycetota bacterium]